MQKSARSLLYSLLIISLAACSNSKNKKAAGDPARTREEALARLSPQHRANFENWTRTVVKSCSASEAFGLQGQSDLIGIDGAAVLMKNGSSLVFEENNQVAALTDYNAFTDVSETRAEEEVSVNGETYSIQASTKRDHSVCVITLFGVNVHATTIAENVRVGFHYQPGKVANSSSQIPTIRQLGANSFEAVQSGVFSLVGQTFRPTGAAVKLIALKLGLNDAQAAKYIKEGHASDFIVRLANEGTAVWTGKETAELIAARDPLLNALGGSAVSRLEVRLGVPSFASADQNNDRDRAGFRAIVEMRTDRLANSMNYATQSVEILGLADKDADEAVQCTYDRAQAYQGIALDPARLRPSVHTLLAPCQVLNGNIEKMSFESGFLKTMLPVVFAGVQPSRQVQYGGWDEVLTHYALEAVKQNRDLSDELDPDGRTVVIDWAAHYLNGLKGLIGTYANLTPIVDDVYQMGLQWTFAGEHVGADRITQILRAADNAIAPFRESTLAMLRDLGAQPFSRSDELAFAQTLEGSYKAQAQSALALSRELGYLDFEKDVFNRVIQLHTPVSELTQWNVNFGQIKTEIVKYPNFASVKNELVGSSVKWLKSGQAVPADLSSIYASINNAIVPFEDSAKLLVTALVNEPLAAHRAELAFAQTLSPEYKQLAGIIRGNARASGYEDWGKSFFGRVLQDQPSLDQVRTWNDLWAGAAAFTARENARTTGQVDSQNEWNRKQIVDRALTESWGNADFVNLETIAEVARFKTECQRHKGMSSLADCGGMGLFSKAQAKFLYPDFGGRYVQLSREFAGYLGRMSAPSWMSLKSELVRGFFGFPNPVWSKCDAAVFQTKAAALKADVNEILGNPDMHRKNELEQHIRETLSGCP